MLHRTLDAFETPYDLHALYTLIHVAVYSFVLALYLSHLIDTQFDLLFRLVERHDPPSHSVLVLGTTITHDSNVHLLVPSRQDLSSLELGVASDDVLSALPLLLRKCPFYIAGTGKMRLSTR